MSLFLTQKQRDQMKEELRYARYPEQIKGIYDKWIKISDQQKKDLSKH